MGNVTLTDSEVYDNVATSPSPVFGHDGGGIRNVATLRIERTRIVGNAALNPSGRGGGLWSDGRTTVVASEISGNRAAGGGGVGHSISSNPDVELTVANSTISGNVATGYIFGNTGGGGIWTQSPVTLVNSTVTGNQATAGARAGGIYADVASVILSNSIVAGNTFDGSAETVSSDCGGFPFSSAGHNLVGVGTGCPSGGAGDQTIVPFEVFTTALGPLGNHGGPTKTHALLEGSPAIDAGDGGACAAPPVAGIDQRGISRPQGAACDVGAVEQEAPPLRLDSIEPLRATAGGGAFPLGVTGAGFTAGSVVHWNGTPRDTLVLSPTLLTATIPASDLAIAGDIATALVRVANPGGQISDPLPFTITSAKVERSASSLALPGESATASTTPTVAGKAGVSATLTNNTDGTGPATVTAATYSVNPAGGTIFAGGGFVDLRVVGADPTDTAAARFYYPTTVTGAIEANLKLTYWTGSAWAEARGSGAVAATKDTTNSLDGTVSGGRFSLNFDDTSTPKITELGGTVFSATLSEPLPEEDILVNGVGSAVDGSDGRCTLVEAILAANTDTASGPADGECAAGTGADTIRLQAGETYLFDEHWSASMALPAVTSAVTIEGNGATIQRDELAGSFGLVLVGPSGNLTLEDAAIRFARKPIECGGAARNLGTLTLLRTTLEGNRVVGASGGAAICNVGGTVTLTESTVRGNLSAASGPGLGGAIQSTGSSAVVKLVDTVVDENSVESAAGANGGGIGIGGGSLSIRGGAVARNRAIDGAGIAVTDAGVTLTLDGVDVHHNVAGTNGGGIYAQGDVGAVDSTIRDNSAFIGGGLYSFGATTLRSSTVSGNESASIGGGIVLPISGAPASLVNSTVSGNVARGGGLFPGAGAIWALRNLTVTNSTIAGNTATLDGAGGITTNVGATVALRNSILAGNGLPPPFVPIATSRPWAEPSPAAGRTSSERAPAAQRPRPITPSCRLGSSRGCSVRSPTTAARPRPTPSAPARPRSTPVTPPSARLLLSTASTSAAKRGRSGLRATSERTRAA